MTNDTRASREQLIEDFRKVIGEAEKLIKATADDTNDKIVALRARAEENLRDVRRKLEALENDIVEQIMEQSKAAAKATDQLVHDYPWQAVAVAACVGMLLDLSTGRR